MAGVGLAVAALTWIGFSYHQGGRATSTVPLPQVTVSKPLVRDVDTRIGLLGQFSAINRVELRPQVGGTLTEIHFQDGQIVKEGDLLFVIDPRPYEIKLARANALLQTASARLALATSELGRAQSLQRSSFATPETVDQRTSEQSPAQAAIDDAKAQIRDAQLDLEYTRITAPFTGRIGARLVSIGSLIAGSRAGSSPTTLLTTLVSLDPIYLDFDMSESDYLTFSRERARLPVRSPMRLRSVSAMRTASRAPARSTSLTTASIVRAVRSMLVPRSPIRIFSWYRASSRGFALRSPARADCPGARRRRSARSVTAHGYDGLRRQQGRAGAC